MHRYIATWFMVGMVVTGLARAATAQRAPEGQLTIAFDAAIAPTFLDPAASPTVVTSSIFLYALHDALLKPLPGQPMAPAVAESWTESPDGRVYEFTLRQGLTFHNGALCTAADVQFSFLRYKGASAKLLHERVQAVEVIDAHRLRFVLHIPWPDFLTVFTAMGSTAAWVVPKQYVEQVGDEGFMQHPIGLGPYRFIRASPGVELVLEAYDRYWRKTPAIQRLVFKAVPDRATRLAMLKTGEADITYNMLGDEGRGITSDPTLRLMHASGGITEWVEFLEQWDPTSPWHDRRVRLAATLAIDTQAIIEAVGLGFDHPTGSIIPRLFEFALPLAPLPYDPAQAKRLLAEAGYPHGFEAGDLNAFPIILHVAEAVGNYLGAVGIRTTIRTLERAAWALAWREKRFKGLAVIGAAAPGNAATRLETFVLGTGYAYGSYPDLDALFRQQTAERDRSTREALLHRMQTLMHQRVMHAPLRETAAPFGVGPRVEESGVGLIPLLPFPAPYEDMRLKRP